MAEDRISARLLALQQANGGWGTTAGRPANTESTALAMLALAGNRPAWSRALGWLVSHQRADGSWPWTAEVDAPSWVTSVAVTALADAGRERAAVDKGVAWLLRQEGRSFGWWLRLRQRWAGRATIELDSTLAGWPWTPGTLSWIEPTAFAVLALKMAAQDRSKRRVAEAERMIVDRECPGGGWNYGNGRVFGVDLEPYPDTTALALLALQGADVGSVRDRGLRVLDRLVESMDSGLALALGALCLRAHGRDVTGLVARLDERFAETGFMDDTRVIALAALAARESSALVIRRW